MCVHPFQHRERGGGRKKRGREGEEGAGMERGREREGVRGKRDRVREREVGVRGEGGRFGVDSDSLDKAV